MDPEEQQDYEDMILMSDININIINENLYKRFQKDLIYTNTGSILISVNPYKQLDIYSEEQIKKYNKTAVLETPHVFKIARNAYKNLRSLNKNQSCVISGESGAGKTETTKFLLQYLCSVSSDVDTWVEQQILEANTVLEAFGNARTIRNDNSSRFGKFMQVCFDEKLMIRGCIIQDYLLEQSRITFQSPKERNYHVFYQLVAAAKNSQEIGYEYAIDNDIVFEYIGNCEPEDCQKFDNLRLAFNVLQIEDSIVRGIFSILTSILYLGNVQFQEHEDSEKTTIMNGEIILSKLCKLLKLSEEMIRKILTIRQINVRGNITEIPLKMNEAIENRQAMAKALYVKTFAYLIHHINKIISYDKACNYIGLLDIFGFEDFNVNSFEQLCINYANEKLHSYFNTSVFAIEQEIYEREGIQVNYIHFVDNSNCLELIEKPPTCILKLLTEQCHLPKGSDDNYLISLNNNFSSNISYVKEEKLKKNNFTIRHYAGDVTYNIHGFVDKNRDVIQDLFFHYLEDSECEFIRSISVNTDTQSQRNTMKGRPTVAENFRSQLSQLVDVLKSTEAWYVRCIKPNNEKMENIYDNSLVLCQLNYLGMMEIVKIRKHGYPIHFPIQQFRHRYKCLDLNHQRLLQPYKEQYKIGKTLVFLKSDVYEIMENQRNQILCKSAILLVSAIRGFLVKREYLKKRRAILKIQSAYRTWVTRLGYLKKRRAVITIQSHLRGMFAREVAHALRDIKVVRSIVGDDDAGTDPPEDGDETDANDADEEDENVEEEEEEEDDEDDEDVNELQPPINQKKKENVFDILEDVKSHAAVVVISPPPSPPALLPPPEIFSPQKVKKVPTLPEPTVPPPPPPNSNQVYNEEPIYESIRPRLFMEVKVQQPPQQRMNGEKLKPRVEKKLKELEQVVRAEEAAAAAAEEEQLFALIEFAEEYFNNFEKETDFMTTLTRKRKTENDFIPKYEMISCRINGSIPNSHLHLYDPSNVFIAVTFFKDLCKYMKSELKESEINFIQNIITMAIQREELRDEIYVQLIRQTNFNNFPETHDKIWLLFCLVVVSFPPGKILQKYLTSYLKNFQSCYEKVNQSVLFCLENLNKMTVRRHPPSSVEIAAMKRLGTIVCRFFFLNGVTKAIDICPTDTAKDAIVKLMDKMNMTGGGAMEGWAIYQVRDNNYEEHVPFHYYIYDVIYEWEGNNNKKQSGTYGDNRFVFKKRLFKNNREIPQDPVEVNLLYAQAVHSVVKKDEYPVAEKVALQLAGLQLQVQMGDFKGPDNYNVDNYLPHRISKTRPHAQWMQILAQGHRNYGSGKSELVAKVWYLSCVMQYPLYGTTMFHVTYKGYWLYGNTLVLGLNSEGISMIKQDDKFIMYEYSYDNIESINVNQSERLLTINLSKSLPPDTHKCFVFECHLINEVKWLFESYCPAFINHNSIPNHNNQRGAPRPITNADRNRLNGNVNKLRRELIETGMLKKPSDKKFFNTLRRLKKFEKNYYEDSSGEFPYSYFAFSKHFNSFLNIEEDLFSILIEYSGLNRATEVPEEEQAKSLQLLLEKVWRSEDLKLELYLELIKETTDHPEPNSKVNQRFWAALALLCTLFPPPHPIVKKYLFAHLKKCAADFVTEEGRFARFCEKCLFSTLNNNSKRQWSPSKQEIVCTINRRPITARFYLMDAKFHTLNFAPNDTANDLLSSLMEKIGLLTNSRGYAIYEVGQSNWERSLLKDEKPVEVMSRWEKQRAAAATQIQFKFVLKKHLFIDGWINLNCPVEKELLYHQLLHSARVDKFPISETEAAMLVALQAQVELGDYSSSSAGEFPDYCHVSSHCLPTRIAALVSHEAVARHHQSLINTPPNQAKQAVLNLLHSWPLYRASIFDVTQSFTSNWPRSLWLAVDQQGIHLLPVKSRHILCTFDYESVMSYSPSPTCFMLITSSDLSQAKPSKIILSTNQAYQISQLIREYIDIVFVVNNNEN